MSGSLSEVINAVGDFPCLRFIVFVHIAIGSIGINSMSDVKLGGLLFLVVVRSLNLFISEV